MLIACPYCGPRDVSEFTYQGDGNRVRPDPMSQDLAAWNEYVYDRLNVAGDHNEIWQHSGGCRVHLRVTRNTLTHKISAVAPARPEPTPVKPPRPVKAAATPPANKPVPKRSRA
jgi:heterotetrameric sarcosine oxidase delta subunit